MNAALRAISGGLFLLLFAGIYAANAAEVGKDFERQQALAQWVHPEAQVRREAILKLGKVGLPADTEILLTALHDPDPESARLAEAAVWAVWSRSGDKQVDSIFKQGIYALSQGMLATSVELFSKVIKRKPIFAEAWNQRATAYFLMGDYQRSLKDCAQVLKHNPKHFGALAGYGQIYFRLDNPQKALRYFQRALVINPNMEEVNELIERLGEQLAARQERTI